MKQMNLTKDARIFTAQHEEIGNLQRFVLDPKTRQITSIIIQRGGLLNKKEYVLPMEWIDQITDEHIILRPLQNTLEDLPLFEEERYVIADEHALLDANYVRADPALRMYFYYPPATYTPYAGAPPDVPTRSENSPNFSPSEMRGTEITGSEGIRKEVGSNIPDDNVALKEGAKVWSQDAHHVGDVEKIFFNPDDQKATHLLVSKGLLNKQRKLIPVDWVDEIYEDRVNLVLRDELIKNLPEYRE